MWFDGGHWLNGLLEDAEVRRLISSEATLAAMLQVELHYSEALAATGVIDPEAAASVRRAIEGFRPDLAELAKSTGRDGVVVPALVAQLRDRLSAGDREALHSGMTSQDVIDTALVLNLRPVCAVLEARLGRVLMLLDGLNARFGARSLMGHTRMQPAQRILVSHRLAQWQRPLADVRARLNVVQAALMRLQLGGAVGDGAAIGATYVDVGHCMAQALDLQAPNGSWHSARIPIVDFANWLSLVSGHLGKIGQDIALLAQAGDAIRLTGGGGSSAMPHKQNPVTAELLVTLARFNATQIGGMHQTLVHEQERSGSAWTLEWMILPQMVMATGRALSAGETLLGQIDELGVS